MHILFALSSLLSSSQEIARPAPACGAPDFRAKSIDGLLILGIDVGEERRAVETFLKKSPAPYPTVIDTASDVAKLLHVDAFPTFILIDPNGKIVDTRVGFLKAGPDSRENIGESQLRGMLQERKAGNDFAK